VDCFLNGYAGSSFPISTFYFKLMLFALLPFLVFILSYGIWALISISQRDKKALMNKATSTVVILLFLVQPNIVSYVFNVFK